MIDNYDDHQPQSVGVEQPNRYCLVSTDDFSTFMVSVDQYLAWGWQCQGGVSVVHQSGNYPKRYYYQAMIKVSDLVATDSEASNG